MTNGIRSFTVKLKVKPREFISQYHPIVHIFRLSIFPTNCTTQPNLHI